MRVTNNIILMQGFIVSMKSNKNDLYLFSKVIDNDFYFVSWLDNSQSMSIHKYPNMNDRDMCKLVFNLLSVKLSLQLENNDYDFAKDDPSAVFMGKVENVLKLFAIFKNFGVIRDSILLPNDFHNEFINSNYMYDEKTFGLMSKMLISMYNSEEEFEKSKQIWEHYNKVKKEKNWVNQYFEIV